jgi:hypothetical protein
MGLSAERGSIELAPYIREIPRCRREAEIAMTAKQFVPQCSTWCAAVRNVERTESNVLSLGATIHLAPYQGTYEKYLLFQAPRVRVGRSGAW